MALSFRDIMTDPKLSPLSKLVLIELDHGGGVPRSVFDIAERLAVMPDAVYRSRRELLQRKLLARDGVHADELRLEIGSPVLGFVKRMGAGEPVPFAAYGQKAIQATTVSDPDGIPIEVADDHPVAAPPAPAAPTTVTDEPRRRRR